MHAIYFQEPIEDAHIADILQEIYLNKLYDPYLKGKKDLTILDLGANVGLFSYYASQFGTCHAFEPAREHVATMTEMIRYNKLEDKIKVYGIAVSNENGEAPFYRNGNITAHSLSWKNNSENIEDTVPTWTMKKVFEELKLEVVDFLKLDIEGWEYNLMASKEFAEVAPKIKTIVGEYHSSTETNPAQLINMLRDYGYDAGWTDRTAAHTFYAKRI